MNELIEQLKIAVTSVQSEVSLLRSEVTNLSMALSQTQQAVNALQRQRIRKVMVETVEGDIDNVHSKTVGGYLAGSDLGGLLIDGDGSVEDKGSD